MASKTTINRNQQQDADQKLIDGLTKHSQSVPSLIIAGTSHPTAAIIAVLQARIDAAKATVSSEKIRSPTESDHRNGQPERTSFGMAGRSPAAASAAPPSARRAAPRIPQSESV